MHRILVNLVATALLAAAFTNVAPATASATPASQATADDPPPEKKVVQRQKEWFRLTATVRRSRAVLADVRVASSDRSSSMMRTTARTAEEYACVVRTDRRRVMAYEPAKHYEDGNSYSHRWVLFVYRVDNARRLGPREVWQQQFEMCAVGGGHSWNKWAANFAGATVTLDTTKDLRIGQSWGERVSDGGGVRAQLGFKLGYGGAEVSATVPVGIDDEHRFTGSDGADDNIALPDRWSQDNRVTAYYKSKDGWIFQGTDQYVGNTAHVLYELPQDSRLKLHVALNARFGAHCTKWGQLYGRECEALD